MAVHPLRPATRRRLGRPLPHQQADRPRAHPTPHKAFHHDPYAMVVCGIRPSFPGLSHSAGQITHVLLTRSPLEYPPPKMVGLSVRLACVKHAASVRPEPGSNSPTTTHKQMRVLCTKTKTIKIVFQACISLTRATHPHHYQGRGVRHPHNNTSSVWVCVVLGTLLSSHTTKKRYCQRFSRCPLIFYVGLRVEE